MSKYIDVAPRPIRFYRVVVGEWEYTYAIPPEAEWIRIDIDTEDDIPIVREVEDGQEVVSPLWAERSING